MTIDPKLKEVLESTTFRILPGTYVYTKVKSVPTGKHFFLSQDSDEISVVTSSDKVKELDLIERNIDDYVLIEMRVSLPFYAVGFWAAITAAIASRKANILAVSTYSKDYAIVRVEHKDVACEELLRLGMKELK